MQSYLINCFIIYIWREYTSWHTYLHQKSLGVTTLAYSEGRLTSVALD